MSEKNFTSYGDAETILTEYAKGIKARDIVSSAPDSPLTNSAHGMVQGLTVYGRSHKSKNLLEITAETQTVNGVTFTVDKEAGTITANGTATANAEILINEVPVINGANYTFTTQDIHTPVYIGLRFADTYDLSGELKRRDFTASASNLRVTIKVLSGDTANNVIISPMIYTATDYEADPSFEPYGIHSVGDDGLTVTTANSDNTVTTSAEFTTALPLRGVSDTVRDKLTCTADVKQVETVCGSVRLADLAWNKQGEYAEYRASLVTNMKGFADNIIANALCTQYDIVTAEQAYHATVKGLAISYSYISISDTDYTTVSDFVASLGDAELIYELATPTTTPLTDAESSAFRGLRTFDNTTNITITDEPEFELDYLKNTDNGEAVSRVVDDLQGQINTKYQLSEGEIIAQIANRIYQGTDLTVKFALEIATYNNDPWTWIKARITAGNFTGIHVGDYIPFTTTNGVTLNAQIAGINTYKNYGDSPVGAHIDFICKELWPTLHPINKVNYNNGTADQQYPWLASDAYLWVNSLAGNVPNGTGLNPETVAVDYTANGIYYFLPQQLKNVIIEKKFLPPKRYSASGLLTDDNSWGWANIGKLWFPDECEVYGMPVWGGKGGYSLGGSGLQYPLFAGNMNRLKFRNGSRDNWWLLSPYSGNSTFWCFVGTDGSCSTNSASHSGIATPVCFRVG